MKRCENLHWRQDSRLHFKLDEDEKLMIYMYVQKSIICYKLIYITV